MNCKVTFGSCLSLCNRTCTYVSLRITILEAVSMFTICLLNRVTSRNMLSHRCGEGLLESSFPARHYLLDSSSCVYFLTTSQSPNNSLNIDMCFDDDYRDTYKTRVYIRNGRKHYTEEKLPRQAISWRRRFGFGGSYYPSRYYAQPPAGRYVRAVMRPSWYPQYGSRGGHGRYHRDVVMGGYPRGVVQGHGSRGMIAGGFPNSVMPGGYSNGFRHGAGHQIGARALMPPNSALVSARSFLFFHISCLVPAFLARTPPLTAIGPPGLWRVVWGLDSIVATLLLRLPGQVSHRTEPHLVASLACPPLQHSVSSHNTQSVERLGANTSLTY